MFRHIMGRRLKTRVARSVDSDCMGHRLAAETGNHTRHTESTESRDDKNSRPSSRHEPQHGVFSSARHGRRDV